MLHWFKCEKEDATTEVPKALGNYHEQLKCKQIEQTRKWVCSETYNLSRLYHEEIDNMSRLITSKVIGLVIKNIPPK